MWHISITTLIVWINLKSTHAESDCGLIAERFTGYYADDFAFFDGATPDSSTLTTSIDLGDEGDYYSYRISGTFTAPETATYQFRTTSDDASHVVIDDTVVVNNGGTHGSTTVTESFEATEGETYDIVLYFGEEGGFDLFLFEWMGGPVGGWTSDLTAGEPQCCACVFMTTVCTCDPTTDPTQDPTNDPTRVPTTDPTQDPTTDPTTDPTRSPSSSPTVAPSLAPTVSPTTCYENDDAVSNDGFELSISQHIGNTQFVHAITDSNNLMDVSDDFGFYGVFLSFTGTTEQELICSGSASCHGNLDSNISFAPMLLCNLKCSGQFSCASRVIYMNECVNAQIICGGVSSCDSAVIVVDFGINDVFELDCGASSSCNNVELNVYGSGIASIACIGLNSCDDLRITVDPKNYKNCKLKMYSYSENVVLSNGFGFEELNSTSQEVYIECNEKDKYIKYNESLTNAAVNTLVLNEYENNQFPCGSVTIECFDLNETGSVSSCDMQYSVQSDIFTLNSPLPEAECYWVEVDDIIDISCDGVCAASPTYGPTNAPTSSPTDPTMDPTNIPTIVPTVDPTMDPTSNPTMDPTIDPTADPTIDPTKDPTSAPSIAPTQPPSKSPSNAPTVAPSLNPSLSPSIAPSDSPTHVPTHLPSNAPTFSPTELPSNAPSYSPSSAPTRIPTVDVDDRVEGYDVYMNIFYSISNLTVSNKKFIVANTETASNDLEEILERNYFDQDVLQYKDFWIAIIDINDVNVQDINDELTEYDLDINNIENRAMVIGTRIETQNQLANYIITQSGTETFRQNAQNDVIRYFNNTDGLDFEVITTNDELMILQKFTTLAPQEAEDATALYLAIVVGCIGVLCSVAAFIYNKLACTAVDNAAFLVPLMIALNVYDFLSDVNLSLTIMETATVSISELQFWLGVTSIIFIVLPFASNLLYAMRIRRQAAIRANPAARSYFTKHIAHFIILCVFCAGTYPILGLTSSRIFGLELFNSGLLSSELHQLSKIKIRSTIYLENAPQLAIQILYSIVSKEFALATQLAFVASSLSIIASIIIYRAQRDVSDECVVTKYFMRLSNKSGVTASDIAKIKKYKGMKEALGDSLSAIYNVSNKNIEIGYITINDNGFIIHIQHSIFKEDLESLKNKLFKNQLQTGYNIQITENLYIENLFEWHQDKILLALVKHFHLDDKIDEFSLIYYETMEHADDENEYQDSKRKRTNTADHMLKQMMSKRKSLLPHSVPLTDTMHFAEEKQETHMEMQPIINTSGRNVDTSKASVFQSFQSFRAEFETYFAQEQQMGE